MRIKLPECKPLNREWHNCFKVFSIVGDSFVFFETVERRWKPPTGPHHGRIAPGYWEYRLKGTE